MRRAILFLILIFILASCALSNPARWHTLEVRKDWPDDYASWTYKRGVGQDWAWALFGNDNDGVTPYFKDEPWEYWRWWLRNRFHNWKWYVIGYAWWEEGNPYSSLYTDHLEYKYVLGDWESRGLRLIWVKPKIRSWAYWRPYIGIHTDFLSAWIGWKRRGNFAASIKKE